MFVTGARVQDGTLGATNPLFYIFLVRDDRSEGCIFRGAQWLPLLVDSLPQDYLARPRLIGV